MTEVHADPVKATADGTFIEIANTGTHDIDLFGLQIETGAGTVTVTKHTTLSAGKVMAFAPSTDDASDMPDIDGVRALPGLVLSPAGETIRLLDRDNAVFDSFTTPALPTGASWQLSYDGDWTSTDWCVSLTAGQEASRASYAGLGGTTARGIPAVKVMESTGGGRRSRPF